MLADLVLIAVLAMLGCLQAFVLRPAETRTTAHAISPAQSGYVDPYRSQDGNGHVWLTTAALVSIDRLPGGGRGERILLDAPTSLRAGQTVTVYVAADGRQVRGSHLPGPPVLPRGQGAALLAGLIAAFPLTRKFRRQRRTTRAATTTTTVTTTTAVTAATDDPSDSAAHADRFEPAAKRPRRAHKTGNHV